MKLWFRRHKRTAREDAQRVTRKQLKKARGGAAHPKARSSAPPEDPIKNWESADQQFLRQAGDPFLDG
jgi:hypothetical protein